VMGSGSRGDVSRATRGMKGGGEQMQHYSLEEWADFARGVAGNAKKATMQTHLETGCKQCTKAAALWQRVNVTALRESTYAPPDVAVRSVKGLGAIHGIGQGRKASSRLANLLFDSLRAPTMAGVRSSSSTTPARQLLYGAGNYRIDVRMEPQSDSEKVAIIGQVLNAVDPSKQSPSMPVILFKGKKILSVSNTNSFGEFNLECDLHTDLKLHFKIPSEQEVWIPLVNPAVATRSETADSKSFSKLTRKARKSTKGKA
jgi:hypothetical protein